MAEVEEGVADVAVALVVEGVVEVSVVEVLQGVGEEDSHVAVVVLGAVAEHRLVFLFVVFQVVDCSSIVARVVVLCRT